MMRTERMAIIMEKNQYRIGELADKANVTKRTIHYYMGRGLLPPPEGAGLGTTYSDEHLYRVLLIKKFQDSYLPLDEIKKRIANMDLSTVKTCLDDETLQIKVQEQMCEYTVKGKANNANSSGPACNAKMASYTETASNTGSASNTKAACNTEEPAGVPYVRMEIGIGLELHYPSESKEAMELAGILQRYAQKLLKES